MSSPTRHIVFLLGSIEWIDQWCDKPNLQTLSTKWKKKKKEHFLDTSLDATWFSGLEYAVALPVHLIKLLAACKR